MDINKALQRRYNINPTKEYIGGIDCKRYTSLETGQVFNGVEIKVGKREVHNLLRFFSDVMDYCF